MKAYSPRLYGYYQTALNGALKRQPELKRNHPNTVFACSSINFGPKTVSYPHLDHRNLSWGWCAVTALGSYDADHGGHLVLWDLGYAVRFPPGSTILLPSAMIRHSNTAIAENETRYSYAQYSAGDLFRWAANGYMSNDDWNRQATPLEMVKREKEQMKRWANGLAMFSTVNEFA
jgi:hypothetical protein